MRKPWLLTGETGVDTVAKLQEKATGMQALSNPISFESRRLISAAMETARR